MNLIFLECGVTGQILQLLATLDSFGNIYNFINQSLVTVRSLAILIAMLFGINGIVGEQKSWLGISDHMPICCHITQNGRL